EFTQRSAGLAKLLDCGTPAPPFLGSNASKAAQECRTPKPRGGSTLLRFSDSARHRISLRPQILSQLFLHLSCGFERHRIVAFVHLGHEAGSIFFHHPGRFVAVLVVLKPFLWIKPCHSNIETGLGWIATGIEFPNARMFGYFR